MNIKYTAYRRGSNYSQATISSTQTAKQSQPDYKANDDLSQDTGIYCLPSPSYLATHFDPLTSRHSQIHSHYHQQSQTHSHYHLHSQIHSH